MKKLSLILILAALALARAMADETNEAPALDDRDVTNAASAVISNALPVEIVKPVITTAPPPPPASTSSAPRLDIASFRLIWERNIFDPNRSSRAPYVRPVRNEQPRRTSRTDSFSLVGTMAYEAGRYAFFDGTSAFYRKVAKPSDTIAGYKVAEVSPNSVKLTASDGKEVVLPVGMQMRRLDEGAWNVVERSEPLGSSPRGNSSYSDQGSDFGNYSTFDRGNFGGGGRRGGGGGGSRFGGGRNDNGNGNGFGGRNDNSYGGRNDNGFNRGNDNSFNRRTEFNSGNRIENGNNSNDTSRQFNQRPVGNTEPPPVPEGGVTEDKVETPAQPAQNNSNGGGADDDVVKRLLQKREQEINK